MNFQYTEARQLLDNTPRSVSALLRGLAPSWLEAKEQEDSWTVRQIVHHLLFAERYHWPVRVRTALSDGDPKTFAPFDTTQQFLSLHSISMEQALDELCARRVENVAYLDSLNLSESDFDRIAIHPSLGAVQLRIIVASWAAHDLAHLAQVSRILIRQYKDAVGPWAQNMSLLRS